MAKRKHGRGSQRQQPSSVPAPHALPQQPVMMYPFAPSMVQPSQATGGGVDDSSSSSSSDSSSDSGAPVKYQKNDEALLTRSATYLGKLPGVRLQQLVETACKDLDPSATASADASDLSRLLYILTKLRPDVRASSLRTKNYKHLKARVKTAAARVAAARLPDLSAAYPGGELDPVALQQMAAAAGFQEGWLEQALAFFFGPTISGAFGKRRGQSCRACGCCSRRVGACLAPSMFA